MQLQFITVTLMLHVTILLEALLVHVITVILEMESNALLKVLLTLCVWCVHACV